MFKLKFASGVLIGFWPEYASTGGHISLHYKDQHAEVPLDDNNNLILYSGSATITNGIHYTVGTNGLLSLR